MADNDVVNAAYASFAGSFTPEQLGLLKALTQGADGMAAADRVRLINEAAKNLYGSVNFSGKSGDTFTDIRNVAYTYMNNPANGGPAPTKENLDKYTNDALMRAKYAEVNAGIKNIGTGSFSIIEFIQHKFTIRTISFLAIAVLLLWIGLKGISTPAIKIARGSVQ